MLKRVHGPMEREVNKNFNYTRSADAEVYGRIKHFIVLTLNGLMKLAFLRIHLTSILGSDIPSFINTSYFLINLDCLR